MVILFGHFYSFKLNFWDVGGQKSLRSYWRNYFESTDGLIWVVDSVDRWRMDDCKKELHSLLLEEVSKSTCIDFPCQCGIVVMTSYKGLL